MNAILVVQCPLLIKNNYKYFRNIQSLNNADGNLDKLTRHAIFLTPKTPRTSLFNSSNGSELFNTSPPDGFNSPFIRGNIAGAGINGGNFTGELKPSASPAITPPKYSNYTSDSNILNERFDIDSLLAEIGMIKYIPRFMQEEIDLFAFFLLDEKDLNEMGIPENDKRIILEAIKAYAEIFIDTDNI